VVGAAAAKPGAAKSGPGATPGAAARSAPAKPAVGSAVAAGAAAKPSIGSNAGNSATGGSTAGKTPINRKLDELRGVQARLAELGHQAQATIQDIRNGFADCVVVFIDMVDSTQFKLDHADAPERWILRVRQFTETIAEYVTELGGEVVKYIGDEVMASFTGQGRVNDALNLLLRLEEMQTVLGRLTGTPTAIKIVADKGPVYLLKYEDHGALDPQGTPVDRCARIAKFAKPGTVLTSHDFAKESAGRVKWSSLGTADLKGIGPTAIFQLGSATVSVAKMVELPEAEVNALRERVDVLTVREQEITAMNARLQEQLERLDADVRAEDAVAEEDAAPEEKTDVEWDRIKGLLQELKQVVNSAPVPSNEYARFLFLSRSDGADRYNKFERTFDASIENKLVVETDGGYWELNVENRRNKRAMALMERLQTLLDEHEAHRPEDDEELFAYSLSDPSFWDEKMGFNVG
jgi:class 3 adenylate cyclase